MNGFESEGEQGVTAVAFRVTGTAELATDRTVLPAQERSRTERALGEGANRRRRVLAIMYQFPPATEVGARSCAQICRYLPAYRWDVIVLTVRERYIPNLDGQIREVFPGTVIRTRVIPHPFFLYRQFKARLKPEPQMARGSPMESADWLQRTGLFRRWLLSILGLPDRYTGWIPPALMAGLGAVCRQEVQCLFSSGPCWTNHLVGLALAQLTGLPWVAHFRDPWILPQWCKPVTNMSIRIEKALERLVLRKARTVVCVTEQHTALLQQAHPDLHPSKFITIPNGYDGAEWETVLGDRTGGALIKENRFVITHAGNLYHRRSPYPLFRALRSLIDSGDIAREHIQVELLGHGDVAEGARVADVAATYGLADRVNLPGFLSRTETLRRMAQSGLLLLLAEDWAYRIPAKAYEYLRARRPILALTSEEAVVDLLRRTGGGWVVDPGDSTGIMAAVKEAYRCWRDGADGPLPNQDVVAGFDRRALAGRFAEVFDSSIAELNRSPLQT